MKYLLFFLSSLVLLLSALYYYLIHTESGGRVLLDFVVDYSGIQLEYNNMSGTVADGLQMQAIKYVDDLTEINIEHLSYQIQWSIFSRNINFSLIDVEQLDVWVKQSKKTKVTNQNFEQFSWPLALNIRTLNINQLTVHDDQRSQTIKQLQLKASAKNHTLIIENFNLDADDFNWKVSGTVDTKNGLSYQLQSALQTQIEHHKYTLNGSVTGDLNSMNIKQNITAEEQNFQGDFKLSGTIKKLTTKPVFQLGLYSDDVTTTVAEQAIAINQLKVRLQGPIDNYLVELESSLTDEQQRPIQISMDATGDSGQLNTNNTRITTQQGNLFFNGGVSWQSGFELGGSINVTELNPGQWFSQWPGNLNGIINVELTTGDNGIEVTSKNNQLQGKLKEQPISLNGAFTYAKKTINAQKIKLKVGQNEVIANGQITPQVVDLEVSGDLTDLSLFNNEWSGQINGKLDLSGNYQSPELITELHVQDLNLSDIQVEHLQLDSQGFWGKSLTTTIQADSLMLNHTHIEQVDVKQSGWLNNHRLSVSISHEQIKQDLEVSGSLNLTNRHWNGLLEKHLISDAFNRSFSLQAPVAFSLKERLQFDTACWEGVEQGSLCIELAEVTNNPIQEKLNCRI